MYLICSKTIIKSYKTTTPKNTKKQTKTKAMYAKGNEETYSEFNRKPIISCELKL
jgi:hypothetical protein